MVASNAPDALAYADIPLNCPSPRNGFSPLAAIIPGQLFAYHLALAKHLDTNHPRHIQKVTRTSDAGVVHPAPRPSSRPESRRRRRLRALTRRRRGPHPPKEVPIGRHPAAASRSPGPRSMAVGAALPLVVTAIAPAATLVPLVAGTSLAFLALLGGLAAHTGGARVTLGAMRVTFWGALAMAVTAGVGALCGTVV